MDAGRHWWIFQECRRSNIKLSPQLSAANWTCCKHRQSRNCLRWQATGKTKCINSPLPPTNFFHIRTGKDRLTEAAAAPKVGVETIGRMPSPSSCDSWLESVPGGSKISSMDPLHLSTAIPHFSVAGRSSPIPSVVLGELTANFVWAIEKPVTCFRIKDMQNVGSCKCRIIMVLFTCRNSECVLGWSACSMYYTTCSKMPMAITSFSANAYLRFSFFWCKFFEMNVMD